MDSISTINHMGKQESNKNVKTLFFLDIMAAFDSVKEEVLWEKRLKIIPFNAMSISESLFDYNKIQIV